MSHRYSESGGGFCGICDDAPGTGEHAPQEVTVTLPPEIAEYAKAQHVGGYSINGQDVEQMHQPQARLVGYGEYTIAELQARSHQQSKDKGFHDYQPTDLREIAALNAERVALFHSEASEALEEMRSGHPVDHTYYSHTTKTRDADGRLTKEVTEYFQDQTYSESGTPDGKPEGVPSECADMVIRVMDFCGANGIDLQAAIIEKLDYNATRAKMHGGKKF